MDITNVFRKLLGKLVFLFFTAVALFDVTAVDAYLRPANPTMDYVPQNVGIYDTYYENFKEPDCRACHGASTAERHHGTQWALQGDCLYCHSVAPDIAPPERDCKVCHVDAGPIGDLGFPHHNSDLADSDQCTACHDPNLLSETNTVEPPTYEPTSITPTPYSCENCHWPSGAVPHGAPDTNDWLGWNSAGFGPKPTTWPDGLAHPQPIEANGAVDNGVLLWDPDPEGGAFNRSGIYMPDKPFRPLSGTHHEVNSTVYWKCYNCHASSPEADPNWVPSNPFLIRSCENCHDIGTLHGIAEHVTSNDIYRVGGEGNQTVSASEKCVACHGDYLGDPPEKPATVPKIGTMEPNFGSAGVIVSLTPQDVDSFGDHLNADRVLVGHRDPYSGCGSIEYLAVPIYSWTENEIRFKIPAWIFFPGNLCVKIRKETQSGIKTSPVFAENFSLREHPKIYNLNPSAGPLSSAVLKINGRGFYVKRQQVYANGYGYSSYVEFHASNDKYRAVNYLQTWSQTQIKIRLMSGPSVTPPKYFLYDVNNSKLLIDPAQFYEGCWETYVYTDYFKDNGNGKYLKLAETSAITGPLGTIDPADELIYREISDPKCFTVTDKPYINSVKPATVYRGNIVRIYGVNFGPTKHANDKVQICDDAACSTFRSAGITLWTNTLIKFKAPLVGPPYPKTKWVRVHVDEATIPNSNVRKLVIK